MRRVITEWGIAISLILIIALALVWADSRVTKWGLEPLAAGTGVYLKSNAGLICLCSELGEDWKPVSTETGRRAWMATHYYATWRFPGIEYHNRQYTSGRTVWSLEVSLLIPLIFLAVVMALCWRLRPRTVRSSDELKRPRGVDRNMSGFCRVRYCVQYMGLDSILSTSTQDAEKLYTARSLPLWLRRCRVGNGPGIISRYATVPK